MWNADDSPQRTILTKNICAYGNVCTMGVNEEMH